MKFKVTARRLREDWAAIAARHPPPPPVSRGLGDTLAKLARPCGATLAAIAWEAFTGYPCGCQERQAELNAALPYKPPS